MQYKHIKPKTPGIYIIRHLQKKRRYIGSAKDIRKRILEHRSLLRRKKHWNCYLQNDWNKTQNKQQFQANVLEVVTDIALLENAEQNWVDQYFDKQNLCYNIRPIVDRNIGFPHTEKTKRKISKVLKGNPALGHRAKTWDVCFVSPKGEEYYSVFNLESFSKTHNINPSSLWKLAKGDLLTYKGWRLSTTPNDSILSANHAQKISKAKKGTKRPDVFKRHAKTYNVKLLSPSGEVYGPITGLAKFARQHNLLCSKLCRLLNGKAKSHKGWTVCNIKKQI